MNRIEILQVRYRNGRTPFHDCFTPLFQKPEPRPAPVGKPIDGDVRNGWKKHNKASRLPRLRK